MIVLCPVIIVNKLSQCIIFIEMNRSTGIILITKGCRIYQIIVRIIPLPDELYQLMRGGCICPVLSYNNRVFSGDIIVNGAINPVSFIRCRI